eukprot:753567-Rhodomonas_salina.2
MGNGGPDGFFVAPTVPGWQPRYPDTRRVPSYGHLDLVTAGIPLPAPGSRNSSQSRYPGEPSDSDTWIRRLSSCVTVRLSLSASTRTCPTFDRASKDSQAQAPSSALSDDQPRPHRHAASTAALSVSHSHVARRWQPPEASPIKREHAPRGELL